MELLLLPRRRRLYAKRCREPDALLDEREERDVAAISCIALWLGLRCIMGPLGSSIKPEQRWERVHLEAVEQLGCLVRRRAGDSDATVCKASGEHLKCAAQLGTASAAPR